jgi:toxin ParE1/3/4
MKLRIRVARSAVGDLDEIWTYIAKRSGAEAAERLVSSIVKPFPLIGRNPAAGRNRAELGEGLRSFAVGSYRIYYRKDSQGIVRILHVRHAARDERKFFKGMD